MYTYEITNDENGIIAWIKKDNETIIMQPHHHNALNNAPWESESEAEDWAKEAVVNFENADKASQDRFAQENEDRQRLINVENMLKQLLNQK